MNIFPAIDIMGGSAVRLYKGDYNEKTVYSDSPARVARGFEDMGASFLHLVDLDGAKSGETDNLATVCKIREECSLFIELGGGIRNIETVDKYISAGINRVILGTAAVNDEAFLVKALEKYGDKIAVGVDIKDGYVAIKGWLEKSAYTGIDFCKKMEGLGVKTVICTDISKDGAMKGTNRELYKELSGALSLDIIASGGVSSLDDIRALARTGLYGAIIGKAYYTGAVDIREALEAAKL